MEENNPNLIFATSAISIGEAIAMIVTADDANRYMLFKMAGIFTEGTVPTASDLLTLNTDIDTMPELKERFQDGFGSVFHNQYNSLVNKKPNFFQDVEEALAQDQPEEVLLFRIFGTLGPAMRSMRERHPDHLNPCPHLEKAHEIIGDYFVPTSYRNITHSTDLEKLSMVKATLCSLKQIDDFMNKAGNFWANSKIFQPT